MDNRMTDDFLDDYWDICLENESSLEDAARLTDAGESSGRNGYSFGVKQFDLATNEEAGDVLASILQHVIGVEGSPVSQDDVDRIRANALQKTVTEIDADANLSALRARASAGLALDEARAPLEQHTRNEMMRDVERVRGQLDQLSDDIGAKSFMSDGAFGRLFLIDYENFTGPEIDKFGPYCAGATVPLNHGINQMKASAPFGFWHVVDYLLATEQGSRADATGRPDLLRRLDTVLRIAARRDGRPLPLIEADKLYLRDTLAGILAAPDDSPIGRNRDAGLYAALSGLVERARQEDG
jgi:hypothetical protein